MPQGVSCGEGRFQSDAFLADAKQDQIFKMQKGPVLCCWAVRGLELVRLSQCFSD